MRNSTPLRLLLTGAFFLLLVALVLVLLSSNALAASKIYGTVTDAETDEPIEEADVYVYETDNKDNTHKTTTDLEGYYEVTVDPGHYEIKISKDGYETHEGEEDVGFEEQVEHNAELVPEEPSYLEGYVTDADTGNPIEGAEVTLTAEKKEKRGEEKEGKDDKELSGTTDSEGYYNISCKEGNYDIEIAHESYETHTDKVQIKEGTNSYDASLNPSSGGGGGGGDDDGDDGFEIAGSGGMVMASGWIVAALLLVTLVLRTKKREDEGKREQTHKPGMRSAGTVARTRGRAKSSKTQERPPAKPKSRCPNCDGMGEYYEEYEDYYCWDCKEHFGDME